ncbi:MAG TPA: 16S rRNA (uracil(1498)-N(3))-methyltransferase [Burkholderiaceae bacterium]|jgi:16S rRNA (uracil1498-N3)-methyltransferase|nr:16S rRNA (uracil(1498)-N(3))-methyltransferase [Burkholderiaceae bacterium]HPH12995.1 16S rRNA (uracil(1498)-N(3))-methyltransferase [Burkholderiaceae bacterium]
MPRFYCPTPLATGLQLDLPAGAARHVQVLRLQPGDTLTLFNGEGGEYEATVERMGRSDVGVHIGVHTPIEREARRAIHLAIGMPANDRMDWLVEKATELGVASIQPLMTERTVLRLDGDRAAKKAAHWQSVAVAACEQCGRNRVPLIHPVTNLSTWIKTTGEALAHTKCLLSLREGTQPLRERMAAADSLGSDCGLTFLSGPEGGLGFAEEALAVAAGFAPVSLGERVLRAETAALAALTLVA